MRNRIVTTQLLPVLAMALVATAGQAQQPKGSPDEEAIVKNAEAFHKAFEAGDAKAVAAFWAPDGDYVDLKGKHLKGRPAIEKAFAEFFAENKGLKLRINITALRVLTPELAVEDGTTEVIPPDGGPPSRARYTIVHVKKNGTWQLASVRDAAAAPESNYEHLRGLEWAIGSWAEDKKDGEIARVSFAWSEEQNFIISTFTVTFKSISIGGGTQWIGYDAANKQVRSWTFETGGGFGEAVWTQDGNKWTVKATATLRNGKKMTATNIITRIDANTMSWQSQGRTLDGKQLPDVPEMKLKRIP
jgi:uncharacterized protein (TIGR02246 family)